MIANEFTLPFIKKEEIAKNTYKFYFGRGEKTFDFLPGQYVRMIVPHDNPDDRGTSRFFTISSSPLETDFLIITAKIIKSSFKNALLNLPSGAPIKIFGPLGTLVLRDDEKGPLVFLSGGMGITPFHSMLSYAATKNMKVPLTLFSSFSKNEERIFYEELTQISKQHPAINVIYSDDRISENLLRKYIADVSKPIYYLTGPSAMVEATRELLMSLNIDEEKILTETFTGY